jgi:hypothetical protein
MKEARQKNYVVIKHALKDVNGLINGVMFRGGYAVVEKDSKIYSQIKKLPLIKNQPELPLLALKDLKFIMRPRDVELIYGKQIYNKYKQLLDAFVAEKKQEQKVLDEIKHVEQNGCTFISPNTKEICPYQAMKKSSVGYCKKHILHDPKIEEIAKLTIPKMMTKQEKRELKDRIIKKLEG